MKQKTIFIKAVINEEAALKDILETASVKLDARLQDFGNFLDTRLQDFANFMAGSLSNLEASSTIVSSIKLNKYVQSLNEIKYDEKQG